MRNRYFSRFSTWSSDSAVTFVKSQRMRLEHACGFSVCQYREIHCRKYGRPNFRVILNCESDSFIAVSVRNIVNEFYHYQLCFRAQACAVSLVNSSEL
jgi:hypothetical protein